MRFASLPLLSLACTVTLTACGDSSPGGVASGSGTATGSGSGASTSTSAATSSATSTAAGSGGGSASASASTTGGGGSSSASSSGGPSDVMLAGEARDFLSLGPIVGAQLSLYDMPGFDTMTDDMGMFSVGPLPPDTPVAFKLEASPGDGMNIPAYAGAIVPEHTGTKDRADAQLSQVQQATIDGQLMTLMGDMNAVAPDLNQAIIIVVLDPANGGSALDDGTIGVDLSPAPVAHTFYSADASGTLTLDSSTIAFKLVPAAVFYNLPDTGMDGYTVTVAHEKPNLWNCNPAYPDFPTAGGYITLVRIDCSPP